MVPGRNTYVLAPLNSHFIRSHQNIIYIVFLFSFLN